MAEGALPADGYGVGGIVGGRGRGGGGIGGGDGDGGHCVWVVG